MHVCILPAWYYSLNGQGGGLFVKEQALALQTSGLKVDLYYPALGYQYLGIPKFKWVHDDGLDVFKYQHFSFPKRNQLFFEYWCRQVLKGFDFYLEKHNSKLPDIIHAHSLWGAYAALQIKNKYGDGVPFVYTEHLGKWTIDGNVLPNRVKRTLIKVVEEASVVSAVSTGLANNIKNWTMREDVKTIPNLVDTKFFHPPLVKKTARNIIKLISIGDPWYVKGLDVLIKAVGIAQEKTNKEIHLTLVDEIPKQRDLYPIIEQYKLTDQIHFVGFLGRLEVKATLQNHHCLVSASRHESFGITIIEALACGVPVIATKTSGALDIVTKKTGYLVEKNDPETLARLILKMIDEKDKFTPSVLKNYVDKNFSATAYVEKWLNIYKDIYRRKKLNA